MNVRFFINDDECDEGDYLHARSRQISIYGDRFEWQSATPDGTVHRLITPDRVQVVGLDVGSVGLRVASGAAGNETP